jgi:hypothetical protein
MDIPMPRYFFDVIDGAGVHRDREGQMLPNAQAADDQALIALLDIAREDLLKRRTGSLRIDVRNNQNNLIARKFLDVHQDVIEG